MAKVPFGFESPEDSPGFLLWQTTMTWQRLIKKALEPFNVSHAQFVIMALLLWLEEHDHDTTQIQIAQWSRLDKMTVSKSLKKLTSEGWVNRVEHTRDTRAKAVTLTPQGKALVRRLVPLVEKIDERFFGVVPAQDQRALMHLLNRLVGALHAA